MPPDASAHAPTPAPAPSSPRVQVPPSQGTSYGQVIDYIQDRLYLAAYTHPPNAHTPFPYPVKQTRSPNKRPTKPTCAPSPSVGAKTLPPLYFSIDKELLYNAFYADFGPLHMGHLYRFALEMHEILGDPEQDDRKLVFWSHADSRSRANAACLLACYMILIQSWPPHLALAPLAQIDPPLMPFRDAGYSQADFIINIQDVVYGVWKAKEEGLCALSQFNIQEYETFERVDMGDFNWITPYFVAFASPQHMPAAVVSPSSPQYDVLPKNIASILQSDLPIPFKSVLAHFRSRNVGLVVRLNSELYSPSYFSALGIIHLDMIFDDGTCPSLALVKKFIKLAHDMTTIKHKAIAVHCKAGLGRTGCLIGAYLIYRHGFTANEAIAFMRFMRPGMVVGPQQHWLHLNQGTFREWRFEDRMRARMARLRQSTPPRQATKQRLESNGQTFTPPNGSQKRRALGELDYNEHGSTAVQDENLPVPTPGQPRKTSKLYGERHNPYTDNENEPFMEPDTEIVSLQRHYKGDTETEEAIQLRMVATRTSQSPSGSHKKRAVSCTTTMTNTTAWNLLGGGAPKQPLTSHTPLSSRSGNGSGSLLVAKRGTPLRRNTDSRGAVRKASVRLGSVGTVAHASMIKQ